MPMHVHVSACARVRSHACLVLLLPDLTDPQEVRMACTNLWLPLCEWLLGVKWQLVYIRVGDDKMGGLFPSVAAYPTHIWEHVMFTCNAWP